MNLLVFRVLSGKNRLMGKVTHNKILLRVSICEWRGLTKNGEYDLYLSVLVVFQYVSILCNAIDTLVQD